MEPQIGHPSADSGTPQIRSSERRGKDPKRSLSRLKPYAPFFALIVLSLLVGAMNPRFFEFSNLIRIANSAAIPLVLALGMTFIIVLGVRERHSAGVRQTRATMIGSAFTEGKRIVTSTELRSGKCATATLLRLPSRSMLRCQTSLSIHSMPGVARNESADSIPGQS